MHIIATSDLHGSLPRIKECELLIIAGDICPIDDHTLMYQWDWLERTFAPWLAQVPARYIVGIAGNHDKIFHEDLKSVEALELPWIYLQDSAVELEGLRLYGLPWIPRLPGWAFYAPTDMLALKYQAVPSETDVVISHGPPQGVLDNGVRKFGARQANEMIARVQPELYICGHIHEGYGYQRVDKTDVYNVAHMDITYFPANKPRRVR